MSFTNDHWKVLKALGAKAPQRPKMTTEGIVKAQFGGRTAADRTVRNAYRKLRDEALIEIADRGEYRLTQAGAHAFMKMKKEGFTPAKKTKRAAPKKAAKKAAKKAPKKRTSTKKKAAAAKKAPKKAPAKKAAAAKKAPAKKTPAKKAPKRPSRPSRPSRTKGSNGQTAKATTKPPEKKGDGKDTSVLSFGGAH